MQMFDLRSKPLRFSSGCSLGIKVHECDPNMPNLLAVALMNNEFEKVGSKPLHLYKRKNV